MVISREDINEAKYFILCNYFNTKYTFGEFTKVPPLESGLIRRDIISLGLRMKEMKSFNLPLFATARKIIIGEIPTKKGGDLLCPLLIGLKEKFTYLLSLSFLLYSRSETEKLFISTPLYLHLKLLFPFRLHYYKRKEMPRQINPVKITFQL